MPAEHPHANLVMEDAVLSAVLLEGDLAYSVVIGSGAAGAFWGHKSRTLWFALCILHESGDLASGAPADRLLEVLRTTSAEQVGGSQHETLLDVVGGYVGLSEYYTAARGTCQVGKSCDDLVRLRNRRDIIRSTKSALAAMERPDAKPEEIAAVLEQSLSGVGSAPGQASPRTIQEMHDATVRHREYLLSLPAAALSWGIPQLDRVADLALGRMVVLAGRPGSGKSSLGLRSMIETACAGTRCMFISLELSETDLYGRLEQSGMSPANPAHERIRCISGCSMTASSLVSAVRQGARAGARLIMVDYIQRISGESVRETEYMRITAASMGLTSVAVEEGVCVIALAQLNRGNQTGEKVREPRASDLKGSGSLEQDASIVLLLHQEEGDFHHREIIIAKSRFGDPGNMRVAFDGATNGFRYVSRDGSAATAPEPGRKRGEYDDRRVARAAEISDRMSMEPDDSEDLFS